MQHGRRQQGRRADQGRSRFLDGRHKLGRSLVHTNVGDQESVGREHGTHQRLANLVQVPLYRAEHDLAQHFSLLIP